MSSTLEASVFMGKNYSDNLHSIKNTWEKQMFEISEQLILEQSDEFSGVSQISWESSPWEQLSLVNDAEVISLSHAKVHVFSDSVLCLGKMNQNPTSNTAWEEKMTWFKSSQQKRTLDTIGGGPMEFEWHIFPGFSALQLVQEVQNLMNKMGEPEQFQLRIIFMSMFNDIIWWIKDKETECIADSTLVSLFAKRFPAGRWSFLGPGSEKKWYATHSSRPQGEWDWVAELMMIKFGESTPSLPIHKSLSRVKLKSKGGGKLSVRFCADGDTIETFFRTIISVNQLSIYGAVWDLCEEYSSRQTRTGRLVVAEQPDPLFAPVDLLIMTPSIERVEKLPQPDRLIKICTVAGFLKTVEVGHYFMKKRTDEFLQFAEPVTCRDYTLPRDEKSTDSKGLIRGNTKIGPVLEVTTSYLQGKYGVEIRTDSVNKDISHSWVRISQGLNKLVTDLIDTEYDDNEQETSTTKTEVFAFASGSKSKEKPRRPSTTCSSSRTIPILERKWIDIEPPSQCDQAHPVAQRLNTLLRHGELPREEDGAIEFWRLKDDLRNKLKYSQYWSDHVWKSKMAGGGGNKRRFQYCADPSRQENLYLRALQGLAGRNPIDPTLQDNVLIPNNFFQYIYNIGCAVNFTLHHKFRIDSGRTKF